MVVYVEYLFLENFITGIILLLLTGKALGRRLSKWRALVGGILCGASGFSLFCNWSSLISICLKVFTGILVVSVSFNSGKLNGILKEAAVFVLFTFLSGGIAMAILIWWKEPMIYSNGAVYMAEVTYIRLLAVGVVAFGGCFWTVHMVKERRIEKSINGDVHAKVGKMEFVLKGFLDSGNHLREPISKKPVILIDAEGQKIMAQSGGNGEGIGDIVDVNDLKLYIPRERLVVVPYRTIGTDKGMLRGVRTDFVTFKNITVKGAIVGLYNGKFNGYQALVGKDFIDDEG